jgi:hypothetical protein
MRERIAHQAARIIAEDGLQDYALAKHKAARQIGAPDTRNLPDNDEVERALRDYQALYQRDEQSVRLRQLRQQALEAMRMLEPFNPYLVGSVLNGTATRHAGINLQLFTDSAKEVELFLLAKQVSYKRGEKHLYFGGEEHSLPVFIFLGGSVEVNVTVFSTQDIRQLPREHAEKYARASAKQVEALLEGDNFP